MENIVPPIPADTFVLFGAFLAAAGRADPVTVFLVTWVCNVVGALLVYTLSRRYGRAFFATPIGHWLLHPEQLQAIGRFYARWGGPAVFVSRFLPAFRAMVPVFAGITRVPFFRMFWPLAFASALWYGILVAIGTLAGRNWERVLELFSDVSGTLFWIALPLLVALVIWWWRTRRRR